MRARVDERLVVDQEDEVLRNGRDLLDDRIDLAACRYLPSMIFHSEQKLQR